VSAFAARNEGVGGGPWGGGITEPQGRRGGWLTYTNSSPSICPQRAAHPLILGGTLDLPSGGVSKMSERVSSSR
jgi:hypothetical protein